jgi:hypothetical protein
MAKVTNTANQNLFAQADKEVRTAIPQLVDSIVAAVDTTRDAKEHETGLKQQLRTQAKEEYWELNHTRNLHDDPVHVFDAIGRRSVAQVNFLNKFSIDPEQHARLKILFGRDSKLQAFIQTDREVKIGISELDPQDQIDFMKALAKVCQEHGVEGVMTTARTFTPEFHDARHELLPALNKQIDTIVPIEVHITTTIED